MSHVIDRYLHDTGLSIDSLTTAVMADEAPHMLPRDLAGVRRTAAIGAHHHKPGFPENRSALPGFPSWLA